MSPASMLSVSMRCDGVGPRLLLAMSTRMVSRSSSASVLAEPRMMSALATSARSVLATTPSQKMLTPPSTTGIDAESVVFICPASPPWLGTPLAVVSRTETTMSTNTLAERSCEEGGSHSMPRGTLKDTNWSEMAAGLLHMEAAGAQLCARRVTNSALSGNVEAVKLASHCAHACCCTLLSEKKAPCPTRTESSGTIPVLVLGWYLALSVNVICT
mmetsp:Transcript_8949/g.17878  ORF Transcript_8949/g.17878 Transcript_8949/m.17878 type:complete len:215 (+) Transcript_8949:37-681(+)